MKKQNENKEECDFDKQYLPFKHHNLPTPVWNEERDTLKYIYFQLNLKEIVENKNNSYLQKLKPIYKRKYYS